MAKTKAKAQSQSDAPPGTLLLEAFIPGLPPSTNRLWRSAGRRGGVYTSPEARAWKDTAAIVLAHGWRREAYTGPCSLQLTLAASNRRRWDVDNRIKAVQDALQAAGVIADDCQVLEIHARRTFEASAGTWVKIYAAGGDDAK